MASLRDLRLRIRSIKSTQKIARAMEMVAASKMKRAQQQALAGRPYTQKLKEIMAHLLSSDLKLTHPFLSREGKSGRVAYIVVTADRGLCGGFNSNLVKTAFEEFAHTTAADRSVVTVGKKARQAMQRVGQPTIGDFEQMANFPKFVDTLGIAGIVEQEYLSGKVDEVYIIYNHFYSTMTQKPVMVKILPIEAGEEFTAASLKNEVDYIFEADKPKLLDELLQRMLSVTVYQAILESAAAEHSALMLAMHKASDNAKEIVGNLTLVYNKTRQAKITTQILEIVGGSAQ